MASETLFHGIPPFPDDIPILPMKTASFAKLSQGDIGTINEIMAACQELGFFFLDLRGDQIGDAMVNDIDALFHLSKDILNLPEDVKQKHLVQPPKSFLGFKPRGMAKTETNEPDRFEWFNMGQDGLMGNTESQSLPDLVTQHLDRFKSFLNHGQTIAGTISRVLATQLGLHQDTFTQAQDPSKLSGTVIRIIKAFASPEADDLRTSMIHHTDFGTITLLANVIGGLQVLNPGGSALDENAWQWVRPQPGCLIVNLGDAMVQWTGGLLRSNVHRIKYPPGDQRYLDRYSLVALFRPERNASMKTKVGGDLGIVEDTDLTAWEWEVQKTLALTLKK